MVDFFNTDIMDLKSNVFTYSNNIEKYVHSVRSLSLTKKFSWVMKMATEGNICHSDGTWKVSQLDRYLDFMERFINIMDTFYGDNWDMHIDLNSPEGPDNWGKEYVFELVPIIRYKDFILSNSEGTTKKMKDFLVGLRFTYDSSGHIYIYDILGTKAKHTVADKRKGYLHSHLRTYSSAYFVDCLVLRTFCTGSGEINDIMSQMRDSNEDGMIGLFLSMLDNFIKWESLEGGPHKKMRNTLSEASRDRVHPSSLTCKRNFDFLGERLKNRQIEMELDYIFHKNRYCIRNNKRFHDFLFKFVLTLGIDRQIFLCKRIGDYYYSMLNDNNSNDDLVQHNRKFLSEDQMPYMFIQGNKVEFEIVKFEKKEEDNISEFMVHENFINYVKEEFEKKLYEISVKEAELTEIGIDGSDSTQDTVSLSEDIVSGMVRDSVL